MRRIIKETLPTRDLVSAMIRISCFSDAFMSFFKEI